MSWYQESAESRRQEVRLFCHRNTLHDCKLINGNEPRRAQGKITSVRFKKDKFALNSWDPDVETQKILVETTASGEVNKWKKSKSRGPRLQTRKINRTSFGKCWPSRRSREDQADEDRQLNLERHQEQLQKKPSEGKAPKRAGEDSLSITDGWGSNPCPLWPSALRGRTSPPSHQLVLSVQLRDAGDISLPTGRTSSSPLTLSWDERLRD